MGGGSFCKSPYGALIIGSGGGLGALKKIVEPKRFQEEEGGGRGGVVLR